MGKYAKALRSRSVTKSPNGKYVADGRYSCAVGLGQPCQPIYITHDNPSAPNLDEMCIRDSRWIGLNWGHEPQNEAYLGLAHGYLADQRFVDYYDKPCGTGATAFLVQAIESSLARA